MKLIKSLLDEESIVKLVNRQKLNYMNLQSRIHSDDYLRINLVIDVIHILINYVYLLINIQEIKIVVKTRIVENQVYDLLLDIS